MRHGGGSIAWVGELVGWCSWDLEMSVTAGVTRRDNHQGRRLDDDGPSSDLSDVAWG